MKEAFGVVSIFVLIVMLAQMCVDCSKDYEEHTYIPMYDSKYINECDSLQQQKVVSLSLLNFTLGDSITKNDLKSSNDRLVKELSTTKIGNKTIYKFNSKMVINEKKYDIKCTLITYLDKIGWIEVYFDQNIYNDLIQLFNAKYGNCVVDRWKYKNQSIVIDFNFNENASDFERRNIHEYYNSKNKNVRIKYFDHKLNQEIEKIENQQAMIKFQSDSIKQAKALEIQKEIIRKKKIEEEKKISRETKQI